MLVKKYIAIDMNEAIIKIKQDLGAEALIIAKRKIRKPGVVGFFSKKVLEVTAAKDNKLYSEDKYDAIADLKSMMNREIENRNKEVIFKENKREENKPVEDLEMKSQLNEVKGLLSKFMEEKENKKNDGQLIKGLELLKELEDEFIEKEIKTLEELKIELEKNLSITTKELKGKIVLVGPTGVGKTTTIAKLAGRLSLIEGKKVGLITVDTYRIGAVEQLKTYAEIMDVPFKVVMNPKEMEEALEYMKHCEVVLIDSTGRSSKNLMQISELRTFIDKINPDNISLVISSTTKNNDLKSIINGYKVLGYKDMIITKLDETTSYGTILNASYLSGVPIRFLTNGQTVPDDIKTYSKRELVNLIIGDCR